MENYFIAILYGLVQGLTEFLPVSSSGHLVLLHKYLALPVDNEIAFDVSLHAATLFAVVWFFRSDLLAIGAAWLRTFYGRKSETGRTGWLLVIATIPAAAAGWLGEDLIESYFRSASSVAVMLILVGLGLIISERVSRQNKSWQDLYRRDALAIGLAQALALIPGTSRSGITVIAGLYLGLKREAAVKFSFLLSVPIIAGAAVKNFLGLSRTVIGCEELALLSISFVFAFISGWAAVKYLLRFSQNHRLDIFAWYRISLAVAILIILNWR
ncbi:MAG: undecaprenyl-diphosphatase UppP [Planctomycetes bacterium]|nr:undecaprenyl-diphosphatase UppP [Planctomycetota bacterium]